MRCRRWTACSLALGLQPIVVVNKVDKPGARPDYVINAAFDLFDKLGAIDEQLDFPVVYASGLHGWASLTEGEPGQPWGTDMAPLFETIETILQHVPAYQGDAGAPLQLQISSLDYSSYVGRIGVGRIHAGTLRPGMEVLVCEGPDGPRRKGRTNQVLKFQGLERVLADSAGPGDIVLVNGIEDIGIGVTLCDPLQPHLLPMLKVDEPTLTIASTPHRWRGARASSSPAARSGPGCNVSCRATWRCGCARRAKTASSRSAAAASCT